MPRYVNRWPYNRDEPEAPDEHRCQFELPDGTLCGLGRYPGTTLPFCIFHLPEGTERPDNVVLRFALQEAAQNNVSLWGANLEQADLWAANLHGLMAGCANLQRATLVSANLEDSKLGGAKMARASLIGANLRNAHLRGTDLHEAKLEYANLAGAALVNADLSKARLGGAVLARASLLNAVLTGAKLPDADIREADLWDADLQEAVLNNADLRGANMVNAHLGNARMSGANLEDASLREAHIDDVHLRDANLRNADLKGAKITASSDLSRSDLTGANLEDITISPEAKVDNVTWGPGNVIALEEPDGNYVKASQVYRQIKRTYEDSGQYDRAGEFFFKEMECDRKSARPWSRQRVMLWLYLQLCGYGERPWRTAAAAAVVIALFAIIHAFFGIHTTQSSGGCTRDVTIVNLDWQWHLPGLDELEQVGTAAYFSLVTFTTLGYGDLRPSPGWGRALAGVEAILGTFLMALFLVTFTRKFRG